MNFHIILSQRWQRTQANFHMKLSPYNLMVTPLYYLICFTISLPEVAHSGTNFGFVQAYLMKPAFHLLYISAVSFNKTPLSSFSSLEVKSCTPVFSNPANVMGCQSHASPFTCSNSSAKTSFYFCWHWLPISLQRIHSITDNHSSSIKDISS